jgi:hypothetical protein
MFAIKEELVIIKKYKSTKFIQVNVKKVGSGLGSGTINPDPDPDPT